MLSVVNIFLSLSMSMSVATKCDFPKVVLLPYHPSPRSIPSKSRENDTKSDQQLVDVTESGDRDQVIRAEHN